MLQEKSSSYIFKDYYFEKQTSEFLGLWTEDAAGQEIICLRGPPHTHTVNRVVNYFELILMVTFISKLAYINLKRRL